jgi:hypothetical protein
MRQGKQWSIFKPLAMGHLAIVLPLLEFQSIVELWTKPGIVLDDSLACLIFSLNMFDTETIL